LELTVANVVAALPIACWQTLSDYCSFGSVGTSAP
jgi:hypothetical protein